MIDLLAVHGTGVRRAHPSSNSPTAAIQLPATRTAMRVHGRSSDTTMGRAASRSAQRALRLSEASRTAWISMPPGAG